MEMLPADPDDYKKEQWKNIWYKQYLLILYCLLHFSVKLYEP